MKTTVSKLTADVIAKAKDYGVLVVNREGWPLAWVRQSSGWWNYDCKKVGTDHWQPCTSLAEVKEWIRLNRGLL